MNIDSAEIGKLFFTSGPKWVDKLFTLRNKIVRLLGLKTSGEITNRQRLLDDFMKRAGLRSASLSTVAKA